MPKDETALDETAFRCRMLPTFLYLTIYSQLGYLAVMVPAGVAYHGLLPHAPGIWSIIFFGCLLCAFLSLLFSPLIAWGYPTYVSSRGLKGYNFWGVYHTVAWETITAVRRLHLGVAAFLRVASTETWLSLWVPLFMTDMDRFFELVREYAGNTHPLACASEWRAIDDE